MWWTGSPWRGISVAHPGWALHLRRCGGCSVRQVTRLPEATATLGEAAETTRRALTSAVRSRAERPCSVDLSGGMDSAAIATLAAAHVAKDSRVPAVTLLDSGNDDALTARAIAEAVPSLQQYEHESPASVLPFGDLELLGLCDEPVSAAGSIASERWYTQLLISQHGSRRHLTGEGGDAVLTAPLAYLADLVGLDQWRQSSAWARLRTTSPTAVYRAARKLRSTTYSGALCAYANALLSTSQDDARCEQRVTWFGSPTPHLLTHSVRAAAADALREHAESHRAPTTPLGKGAGTGDVAAWIRLIVLGRQLRGFTQLAAQAGLAVESPWLDDAVVRACWSTPATRRTNAHQLKPLLATALRGVVPDIALTRSTKGAFTALHYEGLRHHHVQLLEMFTNSHSAALGLVDDNAVRKMLQHANSGRAVPLGHLDAVISLEAWLRSDGGTKT
nr:asparagine synthase-related protein [Actinoalloteichus spitiensis]